MRRLYLVLLGIAQTLLAAGSVSAQVTAVNTSNLGSFTVLDSVVIADPRGTVTTAQMTNVTPFHFNNGGSSSFNLAQAGGSAALPAPRQLVMQDFTLNNGIINLGAGAAMTTGTTIGASHVGLGLQFNTPVVNGFGVDALFFELSAGSTQTPDTVSIALLNASNTVIGNELTLTASDYGFHTDMLNGNAIQLSGAVNSLSALNSNAITSNAATDDYFYNLLSLDFSSFGIAHGAEVHGLFIRGANIDPTFVAGLPAIVPEPSGIALWLLLATCCAIGWRRVIKAPIRTR